MFSFGGAPVKPMSTGGGSGFRTFGRPAQEAFELPKKEKEPYRPWTAPAARYGKAISGDSGLKETYIGKQFSVSKATSLSYGVGDRVSHVKFGEGTVLHIVSGGRDFEVTVNFDQFGIKKMFASFAKLRKL